MVFRPRRGIFLRFSNEFLMASGAGDGDFPLSSGDPHHLPAFGAVKIAVVPVLSPANQLQKLPVFLIPLIGVPGQGAPNCPDHQPNSSPYPLAFLLEIHKFSLFRTDKCLKNQINPAENR